MSDHEQAILAEAIATVLEAPPVAAPLVRARETVLAAQETVAWFGRELLRLTAQRRDLAAQCRQAAQVEQGTPHDDVAEQARLLRLDLEQQAADLEQEWLTFQQRRQAQSARLLRVLQDFRSLARQAEDCVARIRQAACALATVRQDATARPFQRLEAEASLEQGVARLAALVGQGEAAALADDRTRTPSWRL